MAEFKGKVAKVLVTRNYLVELNIGKMVKRQLTNNSMSEGSQYSYINVSVCPCVCV